MTPSLGKPVTVMARRPAPVVAARDRILQAAKTLFARHGYEHSSTNAIARRAGTSESQLMKHFGSKDGLLQAIFNEAWEKILRGVLEATARVESPRDRLATLVTVTLGVMENDPELKLLMMLEARRVRGAGERILLDPGFLRFVAVLDGILTEMRAAGQLRGDVHRQALRSALMGAMEGMLRDQLMSRRSGYPAQYADREIHQIFSALIAAFAAPQRPRRKSRG